MYTPLVKAIAAFVAALAQAVLSFRNLKTEQKNFDEAKALKEQQASQEQK